MSKKNNITEEQRDSISFVLHELFRLGVLKYNRSTKKNTEIILRNYNKLKKSISLHQEQIADLKENGVQHSQPPIRKVVQGYIKPDEESIVEETIKRLETNIRKTKAFLKHIDRSINAFKNDPYFDAIKLYYFEEKTFPEIAEYYDSKMRKKDAKTSPTTISTNVYRILDDLKILLFPNDYLLEFMGY